MGDELRILNICDDDDSPYDEILESCKSCPFEDGIIWNLVKFVVVLLQIVAAIVVLTQAKDEKNPQQMYFTLIITYTVGCTIALPILCLRFLHYHTSLAFTTRIYEVIDKLMKMIEYFFVGWVVMVIWYLINNFSSSDTTQQFWLCMVFLAISCVLHVLPNFPCAVICFLYPLLLRLFQYIDFFDDLTEKVDLLDWKIAVIFASCIFIICCVVTCCARYC